MNMKTSHPPLPDAQCPGQCWSPLPMRPPCTPARLWQRAFLTLSPSASSRTGPPIARGKSSHTWACRALSSMPAKIGSWSVINSRCFKDILQSGNNQSNYDKTHHWPRPLSTRSPVGLVWTLHHDSLQKKFCHHSHLEECLLSAQYLDSGGRVLGQVHQGAGMRNQPCSYQFTHQDSQVRCDCHHTILQVFVQLSPVLLNLYHLFHEWRWEKLSKNGGSVKQTCWQRCFMLMMSSPLISVPMLISAASFT